MPIFSSSNESIDLSDLLKPKSSKPDVDVYYNEYHTHELIRIVPLKNIDRIFEKINNDAEPDVQVKDILRLSITLNVKKAKAFLE